MRHGLSEEILVNVTPMETRVAVVENGSTQDIQIERSASRGIVGNIYAGKVVRVLPGMQAAFVDIGTERTSFIHVSDILPVDGSGREDRSRQSDAIRDYLHDGKQVVVQVTKDPIGTKGARLTTQLSVSSRYLVFMPQSCHVGVSQRIGSACRACSPRRWQRRSFRVGAASSCGPQPRAWGRRKSWPT
jgi:ribonuclease G